MKYRNAAAQRGFTLIEVMVVVVVVAILAAVALPNYTAYVQRGYRAQAMATLLQYANWMQQQYTINGSYQLGGTALTLPASINTSTKYGFTINNSAAATYVLWATPVNASDKCGTFTLDNTGKRGVVIGGSAGSATVTADCWAGK